jgi:hypothetical protein
MHLELFRPCCFPTTARLVLILLPGYYSRQIPSTNDIPVRHVKLIQCFRDDNGRCQHRNGKSHNDNGQLFECDQSTDTFDEVEIVMDEVRIVTGTFLRISGIYDQTKIPVSRCLLNADLELSRISAMKFIKPDLTSERNCWRKMLAVFSALSSNSEFPMRKFSDSPSVIAHRQSPK